MNKLRPIMLVGTGSDVGKSWVVAGICRWLKQQGFSPAPFKAQNMSLNSFVTPEGKEIGRAQAVQAEACGIDCHVSMNPVLLKPTGTSKSQVVLHGKPIGDQTAKEYFLGNNRQHLFEEAQKAFFQLEKQYSPVVMEGAGSISELNLKHRDIVNMRMAKAANACVYLVADIDRGGVFGSVYGTIALLEDWEKALLKGIIINKFRGDASLFEDGKKKLEELTGYPVLGVLPFAKDIFIEEEDSVALQTKNTHSKEGFLNIAVVQFGYMSNYTDFQALEIQDSINLYYTRSHKELRQADIIILPGSKNTLADLKSIKEEGIDKLIQERYQEIPILGICGGYQMMGKSVKDPYGVESDLKEVEGLGLFPITTTLSKTKETIRKEFLFQDHSDICQGYEIHMGITEVPVENALNNVAGKTEGYFDGKSSWGTYFHGIFDNPVVIQSLMTQKFKNEPVIDYLQFKAINFDKLGKHMGENLQMQQILNDIKN